MRSLVGLWRGLCNHPWKMLQYTFACFSVLFTLVRGITHFLPAVKVEGPIPLSFAVATSIGYGIKKLWKPSLIEIPIANCNTVLEVCFGDLFAKDGIRVIAVSEFFDSKLGKPVSEKSVHGIFLQKCFGGHSEPFDRAVDEQLKEIESCEVEKIEGKSRRYPIGSTALITVNQDRYLAVASTKADPKTCKVSSDVATMWGALNALWQRVRIESNGDAVNVPLIGSGLAGMGLPTRDLLNLVILSAITGTKGKEITQRIRIALHPDRFDDLDLTDVLKHWKS